MKWLLLLLELKIELDPNLSLLVMWSCVSVTLWSWDFTMGTKLVEDGIPVELFQILKDDAVKVLHSICQQIWKTQKWPQDWKRSVFIPVPKKGNAKECSNYSTIALISYTRKRSTSRLNTVTFLIQLNMQSTSLETLGWRKHKLESRLLGEISITLAMQMTPPL